MTGRRTPWPEDAPPAPAARKPVLRRSARSESQEQLELVDWLRRSRPEALFFHVPNGGWRSGATGLGLKAAGVRAGVPDLVFPMARGGHHGLFIELKRTKGGRLSEAQADWIMRLRHEGYRAEVCHGARAAMAVVDDYLGRRPRCRRG